jgi:NAD(P)-dependent dehydrogenase (short-subunit alcohol dehydrogenase family)
MRGFRDEVAVVTGAGSGIGRALALDLARAGARVEVSDIVTEAAEETATACRDLGAWAKASHLDVADHGAVTAHAQRVEEEHGRVDLVINNAGVALAANVVEQEVEDVLRVLDVNLRGVVHGTQAFLPALRRAPAGRLVNISSMFGLVPAPYNSAYAASKFAVRGYTEALAMDLDLAGSSVTVTCVHPGGVDTRIADNAKTAPGNEELVEGFKQLLRMPPETAARIILRAVARGRRRVLVGRDAWTTHVANTLLGHRFQRVLAAGARRGARQLDAPAAPR